jgi:transcriptional regulator with XRE-family HTH domain
MMKRKNPEFRRLLKARGLSINDLAAQTGAGRSHLSKLLNGLGYDEKPGRGRHTKPKLFLALRPEEIDALGWREEYDVWLENRREKNSEKSSCGTAEVLFHSQASTGVA